jgi:hypothetical protein
VEARNSSNLKRERKTHGRKQRKKELQLKGRAGSGLILACSGFIVWAGVFCGLENITK